MTLLSIGWVRAQARARVLGLGQGMGTGPGWRGRRLSTPGHPVGSRGGSRHRLQERRQGCQEGQLRQLAGGRRLGRPTAAAAAPKVWQALLQICGRQAWEKVTLWMMTLPLRQTLQPAGRRHKRSIHERSAQRLAKGLG